MLASLRFRILLAVAIALLSASLIGAILARNSAERLAQNLQDQNLSAMAFGFFSSVTASQGSWVTPEELAGFIPADVLEAIDCELRETDATVTILDTPALIQFYLLEDVTRGMVNPNDGRCDLIVPAQSVGATYRLYDGAGREVAWGRLTQSRTELDLGLPAGVYHLQVEGMGGVKWAIR